jgi:Family of unknown function (DUF6931)
MGDNQSAIEICRRFELSDESQLFLTDDILPADFVRILLDHQKHHDAVRFLAHLLPKREAVWWACQCARQAAGTDPRPAVIDAIKAAETWVSELNDDTRRAAFPAATAAGLATAAGCAAMGAFASEGSLAPPNAPEVPPGEYLTAQMVAGSVIIAAADDTPEKMVAKYRLYVEQGLTLHGHMQAGS